MQLVFFFLFLDCPGFISSQERKGFSMLEIFFPKIYIYFFIVKIPQKGMLWGSTLFYVICGQNFRFFLISTHANCVIRLLLLQVRVHCFFPLFSLEVLYIWIYIGPLKLFWILEHHTICVLVWKTMNQMGSFWLAISCLNSVKLIELHNRCAEHQKVLWVQQICCMEF